MQPQLLVACDFDGTMTQQDTLVEILNRFGSPQWQEIQRRVVSGQIPIRQGLEAQMQSVRATEEELRSALATTIEIAPSFPPFLKRLRAKGVPVICLSGGFDLCVETVLSKAGLWPLPFLSNRLRRNNGSWHVEFPYPSSSCQACGHCKGDPLRLWSDQGYTTVFIGNGVTDRCAALEAKLTFAKDELESWAKMKGIPAVPFRTFGEIEEELMRRGWL